MPYGFTLDATKLNGGNVRLLVQGKTVPKGSLAQLTLYPKTSIDRAAQALLRLKKALQLIQNLNLNEREVSYLCTPRPDFENFDLGKLATRDRQLALETIVRNKLEAEPHLTKEEAMSQARIETEAGQVNLFKQFLRLTGYASLKRDLAGGTDGLIGIFETADIDQTYMLIAKLTRRDQTTVKATAKALFGDNPTIKDERTLGRLWEALQVIERFGVPVASVRNWTRIVSATATSNSNQRFSIARDLKEAIKARFEPETWQRVAQPIFDKLRQRQRDGLVAHVMHQHGFTRLEYLYEYFLIDPGMEPVVQTSRIRLAISSLQLFIQRILINLEKHVSPSAINAKQWEWMKRYRVWEANRKIFLFPENWLEPEFRDDKTHLFSELEGKLLQGDVSSDLVEDAFLNYLKKLDELARLDIVAMHMEDNPDPALRTLHVIGRTYSEPHKYFYRRYKHKMWTLWEPVTAEIEGDHLAPVVWRDRLYLFWVTFMEKAEQPNSSLRSSSVERQQDIVEEVQKKISAVKFLNGPGNTSGQADISNKDNQQPFLKDLTLSQAIDGLIASGGGQRRIEAQLHWSEYLQGEWSTRESGGFSAPSPVFASLSAFDSKAVFIHVSKDPDDVGGVYIHLVGVINQSFYLAGRNSVPEYAPYRAKPANPYSANTDQTTQTTRYAGDTSLNVSVKRRIITEDGKTPEEPTKILNILGNIGSYTLLPCNNDINEFGAPTKDSLAGNNPESIAKAIKRGLPEITSLLKPVFFQDNTNTLFIEPSVEEQTIEDWKEYVEPPLQSGTQWSLVDPDLVDRMTDILKPIVPRHKWASLIENNATINRDSLVKIQLDRDWLVNPATVLNFGGVVLGSTGRSGLAVLPSVGISEAVASGAIPLSVHEGSQIAPESTVVATTDESFNREVLSQSVNKLNIVGDSGLNLAQVKNLGRLNISNITLKNKLIER